MGIVILISTLGNNLISGWSLQTVGKKLKKANWQRRASMILFVILWFVFLVVSFFEQMIEIRSKIVAQIKELEG